jgi:hypothetical protein
MLPACTPCPACSRFSLIRSCSYWAGGLYQGLSNHDRLKPQLGLAPVASAASPIPGLPLDARPRSIWRCSGLELFFLICLPGFLHAQAGQRWHPVWGGMPCPGLHLMIVQFVILLWRSFNHVKIFNWMLTNPPVVFTISAPKVE